MTDNPFSYSKALSRSMRHYSDHFILFLTLSFFASILPLCSLILEVFLPDLSSDISWMFLPAIFGLYVLSLMALIEAVGRTFGGEIVSLKEVMLSSWGRFWPGLQGYLLFILIVLLGLVMLVVPAIYWMTIFTFFLFVLVLEDKKPWASFRRSHELVKVDFLKVFRAHVIVLTITIALFLPLFIGMFLLFMPLPVKKIFTGLLEVLLLPFYMGFYYQLYDHLRCLKDGRSNIHESLAPRNSP